MGAEVKRGFGWWVGGIMREGVMHVVVAACLYVVLAYVMHVDHAVAVAVPAAFYIGRELRDWEVEVGPGLWTTLGFKKPYPLSPATVWSLEQFRHSLSGWIPVCLLMGALHLWNQITR